MNEWIAAHITEIVAFAAAVGAMEWRVRTLEKRYDKVSPEQLIAEIRALKDSVYQVSVQLADQARDVRDFWRDKWPEVENNSARLDGLEVRVDHTETDLKDIRATVHRIEGDVHELRRRP